jgi:hypothetical protein
MPSPLIHPVPAGKWVLTGDHANAAKGVARMKFSVVVPCFNLGRFLTDCLESIACQTVPPGEVVVVDDGSTDQQTVELCSRLHDYDYPFVIRSLRKPNGGVSSTRNHGIRHSSGDVVLPVDADDKLAPDAVQAFTEFFERNPEVDVCYPDFFHFGNEDTFSPGFTFNRWRLTQQNIIATASAVRRRVFDAGYWYDETMRRGNEDWEFWMRTCALGPFRAVPLKRPTFLYRRWGFSMSAAVDHDRVLESIRARHSAAGIWSPAIEERLRTLEAPMHRVVSDAEGLTISGHDILALPARLLESFLRTDHVSRYLWFGTFAPQAVGPLQLIVNEAGRSMKADCFEFVDQATSGVYLTVFDRLFGQQSGRDWRTLWKSPNVVTIVTAGDHQPRVQAFRARQHKRLPDAEYLRPLRRLLSCGNGSVFPAVEDAQRDDWWYYLTREPRVPRACDRGPGARVLAIALPWLTYGGADFAVRILLEEGRLRSRFDKIVILTFERDEQTAHALFEPLVDAIYHMGGLPGDDERKMSLALGMLQAAGATDLLVSNSRHGFELIPLIRKAGLEMRICAQLHSLGHNALEAVAPGAYPRELATKHAAMVDRLACISDHLTSFMVDQLCFPGAKVRTVRLGIDQKRFHPPPADQPRRRRVIWCGRLSPEKDPLLALRVARQFHDRSPDVEFVFIGEGPLQGEFANELERTTAAGVRIDWIRRSDRIDELLRDSGCLLMTSEFEGIPIVAIEALSSGVPVVMSFADTAMREIARPGQCFEVADRKDVDDYARRLTEALAAPRFAPDPVFSHRRYAEEMMDWLFPTEAACQKDRLLSVFGTSSAA